MFIIGEKQTGFTGGLWRTYKMETMTVESITLTEANSDLCVKQLIASSKNTVFLCPTR